MKLCWSTLNVNNLEESIKFYTEIAGLEVVNRFKAGPSEIAFLGSGETKIELICTGATGKQTPAMIYPGALRFPRLIKCWNWLRRRALM